MLSRRTVSIAIRILEVDSNRGMEFLEKLKGNASVGREEEEEISVSQIAVEDKKEEKINRGSGVTWKEHPVYSKFFRQVEVGVPIEAVKAKMGLSGFDASVLESSRWLGFTSSNDPNSFVPASFL